MRLLRSSGAVLAGFVATFVLSVAMDALLHALGGFPAAGAPVSAGLFVAAAAYRAVFTIVGGFVTARLAPGRPMTHAMVLAAIGFAAGCVSVVGFYLSDRAGLGPFWYALSIPLMSAPCVIAGAWLALRSGAVRTPR